MNETLEVKLSDRTIIVLQPSTGVVLLLISIDRRRRLFALDAATTLAALKVAERVRDNPKAAYSAVADFNRQMSEARMHIV